MEHTHECIENTEKYNRMIEEWEKQWPRHCKKCFGAGQFISYYDPSPPGVALGAGWYTDIEGCECTDHGNCPRCGSHVYDSDWIEGGCPVCNWNWGHNKGDICPEPYECYCYELEVR